MLAPTASSGPSPSPSPGPRQVMVSFEDLRGGLDY